MSMPASPWTACLLVAARLGFTSPLCHAVFLCLALSYRTATFFLPPRVIPLLSKLSCPDPTPLLHRTRTSSHQLSLRLHLEVKATLPHSDPRLDMVRMEEDVEHASDRTGTVGSPRRSIPFQPGILRSWQCGYHLDCSWEPITASRGKASRKQQRDAGSLFPCHSL